MGRKKGREGRERERRKGHGGKEGISFLELCKTREEDHVSKWLRPSSLPERWDHIFFTVAIGLHQPLSPTRLKRLAGGPVSGQTADQGVSHPRSHPVSCDSQRSSAPARMP